MVAREDEKKQEKAANDSKSTHEARGQNAPLFVLGYRVEFACMVDPTFTPASFYEIQDVDIYACTYTYVDMPELLLECL